MPKKILRAILDTFVLLLTGKGRLADEAVEAGLLDYSGQERDRYGR